MYLIQGKLQAYSWGIPDGLSDWRGNPPAGIETGQPEAELWFGAHPNGPSPLVAESSRNLADAIPSDQVPILVKLLAAAKPLSLQIHPSVELAHSILADQARESSKIKLLSDPYAKTEMLIAVTEMSALFGLRDSQLAAELVAGIGAEGDLAAALLRRGDIAGAIRTLISATPETIAQAETELVSRMRAMGFAGSAIAAMQSVVDNYPGDSGILVAALLNHEQLLPGEALYVPTGIIHAYVSGTGVEVMVSSDNVLRLGLTPKTVAVDQALAAMDLELEPTVLRPVSEPTELGGSTRSYAPAGSPFAVTALNAGVAQAASGTFRIVLATHGATTVSAAGQELVLAPGQAVAATAVEPGLQVVTQGTAFIAQSATE